MYGEMQFNSDSGMNGLIHYSNSSAGLRFSKLIEVLQRPESRLELRPINNVKEPRRLPGILFATSFASVAMLLAAIALTSVRPDMPSSSQSAATISPSPVPARLPVPLQTAP
jgi:hypothetical protein